MLKPYSLLLYVLAIIVFFFIGVTYAGIIEAGKGQMLAGGAIILGYGVMGSGIGLFLSLMVASKVQRKSIIRINGIVSILILLFVAYYYIKYQNRQKEKELEQYDLPKSETIPASPIENSILIGSINSISQINSGKTTLGNDATKLKSIGMFSPNLVIESPLYFYNIDRSKQFQETLSPIDSVVFGTDQYQNPMIASAPPYLFPEHFKLDYGILLFKVISIRKDVVEIEVNSKLNKTTWVAKEQGGVQLWPEFLLNVNSVEFIDPNSPIKIKPLDHASEVLAEHEFLQPTSVRLNWMEVNLLDTNFSVIGSGWIKWRSEDELFIRYSLLS